jgi:hypothetical protein
MKSTANSFQGKMDAWIANRRDDRKKTRSCQETTEARLECSKKPTAGDIKQARKETTACHKETETAGTRNDVVHNGAPEYPYWRRRGSKTGQGTEKAV